MHMNMNICTYWHERTEAEPNELLVLESAPEGRELKQKRKGKWRGGRGGGPYRQEEQTQISIWGSIQSK
jgi:hypothetical protein